MSLLDGSSKIALIVSYDSPSSMEIWNVYRDGDVAHFQNQLFWPDNLPRGCIASEISQHIQERTVKTEDGDLISEWDVAMLDIEEFVRPSD